MQVVVGRVARAHGVKGLVHVDVRTDEPERRFADGTTFSTDRGPLEMVSARWHGSRLLVQFAGVEDRATAETLRGLLLEVEVDATERPADPEEFYDHQLVGLTARESSGEEIGAVREVLHLPGHDVLVIEADGEERLVPFARDLVPAVDLEAGFIVVVDEAGVSGDGSSAATTEPALSIDESDDSSHEQVSAPNAD
jgi:16S rRNA processing protein RimM